MSPRWRMLRSEKSMRPVSTSSVSNAKACNAGPTPALVGATRARTLGARPIWRVAEEAAVVRRARPIRCDRHGRPRTSR